MAAGCIVTLAWKIGYVRSNMRPITGKSNLQSLRWIGVLIPCGIVLITYLLWKSLDVRDRAQTVKTIDTVAAGVCDRIGESVEGDVRSLRRMAARWQLAGKPPRTYWEADALHYVHDSPDFQAVEWITILIRAD